ncbi:Putative Ada DNA repair, metal-binding, Homeobox-like domain superfamily [Septoria linicola]|uniref:Ada DNA repair, metal-binding, Homeobox-like domain superfamily n=1 Tax=Septoria linicola TaxID=215465 RepID=A0A9Q9ANU7_9PEZI|nr:putative Ada DNA repair, metal-binding, Homeobox-like domain superfamily [Septoria linicola]USW52385.1 Putative Ada DNA repair, metal-binding, Homeobox-like domain superfamily [Septoria linicola]
MKYTTDAAKWNAVRSKDPEADSLFVYCVKTTKIYCRPICKARLARRSNVEFFDTGRDAIAKGYRACKRCRPEMEVFVSEADKTIESVRRMLEGLPQDAQIPSLEVMAKKAGLTKYHFHRSFKKATGFTPREYAVISRSAFAKERVSLDPATGSQFSSMPGFSTKTGSVSDADTWVTGCDQDKEILVPSGQPFQFDDLLLPEWTEDSVLDIAKTRHSFPVFSDSGQVGPT